MAGSERRTRAKMLHKAGKWVVRLLDFSEDVYSKAVLQDTVLTVLGLLPTSKRLARLLGTHFDYEDTVISAKGKRARLEQRLVEEDEGLKALLERLAQKHSERRAAEEVLRPL